MAGSVSKRSSRGRASGPEARTKPRKVQFGGAEDDDNNNSQKNDWIDLNSDAVKTLINEARCILAELGPQLSARSPTKLATNAFEISPDNLSLHTLRDQLLSKADRSNQRRLFGDNASPAKRRRSSMSQFAGEGELDISWAVYKQWPEGLNEEERLLLDYFKKLKFIYLEQETKMRFMADIQDDLESGKEATVYSSAEVAERERVAKTLKNQLTQAKAEVRGLRKEVDAAADELFQPWAQVERDSREAEILIKEIGDMELELAKIRAQNHGKGGSVAAIAGRDGPLTSTEAEEYCDTQIQQMTTLEGKTANVKKAIENTKKDLVSSLRALDRINAERSLADKFANEAKMGMGVDGGRDLQTERLCASHAATISLLRSLLGIDEIEAISANEIRITYKLALDSLFNTQQQQQASNTRRKRKSIALPDQSLVHVNLRFKDVGGRMEEVTVTSSKGEQYDMPEASMARLRALQKANDVPLIVQEVLAAF
ncbi:hypothetical protein NDA11_001671 [Ustilago hordei]|uniref:Kinetochore protein Sos7 coiled-coil domain-containing protein n=1 Tax=Ustilago hordei TaxID=120017 RepID=I2G3B1_USTHO|nr:uncharacterized protein UHO2_02945 [Ustilago hordei]KAJ1038190.1 hypothetical protein NDA10_003423 [Ustilago hordei]KAJ1585094.1 hypothetical protein NDA15_002826 [Ustilago hordei]KAJ1588016.1 hypothetical protein NDA12_002994 [Ustilago hordei]KAJ1592790.1 hypothetical protein NDA11_001671 [Ustilago hordei]KAJ1601906.1 hypothetical protein NDA14_007486 [Ustilago hordei]